MANEAELLRRIKFLESRVEALANDVSKNAAKTAKTAQTNPSAALQSNVSGATSDYLLIDQMYPQTVVNGAPTFEGGIKISSMFGNIKEVTDDYEIIPTDYTIVFNGAPFLTITLPIAVVGQVFNIKNIALDDVTLEGTASDTIDGDLSKAVAHNEFVTVQCLVANTWVII